MKGIAGSIHVGQLLGANQPAEAINALRVFMTIACINKFMFQKINFQNSLINYYRDICDIWFRSYTLPIELFTIRIRKWYVNFSWHFFLEYLIIFTIFIFDFRDFIKYTQGLLKLDALVHFMSASGVI